MNIDKADKQRLNRRLAFRIYEQVDLFYHKIESNQKRDENLIFNKITDADIQSLITQNPPSTTSSSFKQFLPGSYSIENSTLNVNISTTGISFTCKEALEPGNNLMIRILLLSNMTVIMTCCQIVYVKPSNPFEFNQYPYLIGAHFVNLKSSDKDLLNKHINKKRTRRFIVMGLATIIFLTAIQIPELVLELLLNVFSFIFDLLVNIIHILYECMEYSLDLVIEHVFHTSLHNTQTIVFYIQVIVAAAISYPLFRWFSTVCKNLYYRSRMFYSRKKSSLRYYWHGQTMLHKMLIITTANAAVTLLGLILT